MDSGPPARLCAGLGRVLEGLARPPWLTTATTRRALRLPRSLARGLARGLASSRRSLGSSSARSFRHRAILETSRCSPRRFLSSVNGVAEHFRYRGGAAQKMDLEAVRLFTSFGLRINSPDV